MKKRSKVTLYIGIVIFLIYFIGTFINISSDPETPIYFGLLISFVFALFITLIIILFIKIFIFSIVQPIKRVNQIRRMQDAKYVETNDYEYVRNVPSNYSPALASLLLDQAIEPNKDVLATTLYLINHGYLKEVDGIISVTNIQTDNLMEHEIYLVDVYSKKEVFSPFVWKDKIMADALKIDLVKVKGPLTQKEKTKLAINVYIPILIIIGIFSLLNLLSDTDNILVTIIYILFILALPLLVWSLILYAFIYMTSYMNKKIALTEAGLLEQEKMAKFKHFLKDLSSLESKKTEEYIIWEDYLAFAVALGINNQIYWDENFRKKINATSKVVQMEFFNELSKIGS